MSKINILWVEDQVESEDCKAFIRAAKLSQFNLITRNNWSSAKIYLKQHKEEITAIVLDCYCKLDENDVENSRFLVNVIKEIGEISQEGKKLYPWYVLSAGSKDDFSAIINFSLSDDRLLWDADWTQIYYRKTNFNDLEHLIDSIKRFANNEKDFRIRELYKEVFCCIEKADLWREEAKSILITILRRIYYPEVIVGFEPLLHYNQLRQLLEHFYRACHNAGLLPDVCIPDGKIVNLWESYNYLCGNNLSHYDVRYGEEGDRVLPSLFEQLIRQLLFISNELSHSEYAKLSVEDEKSLRRYFKEEGTSYTLYGFTFILCDLIIWLNKYVSMHPYGENILKIKENTIDDGMSFEPKYQNKKYLIEQDENGNVHCGPIRLSYKLRDYANRGFSATIIEVELNTDERTKTMYPLMCKKHKIEK